MAYRIKGDVDVSRDLLVGRDITVSGNLTVNGTTTTINTTNLDVEDANIIIGNVSVPSDVTANGGGITLKGTTDKTFSYQLSSNSWLSSEHINLSSGKNFQIGGSTVLTSTTLGSSVVTSSLTSVGTLTSGVWNASNIPLANGGTGSSLVASSGSIVFSNASGLALSAVGTTGQILRSGGTSAPSWSSSSYPSSAGTVGNVIRSDGLNFISTALTGSEVSNSPNGNISSTTVQGALDELDNEKVAKAGDTMTGDLILSSGAEILNSFGTEALPSYSFNTENNTGIFRQATGILSISTAGVERVRFSAAGIQGRTGSGLSISSGLASTPTSNGTNLIVEASAGGSTSGNGGNITVRGGSATDGNGGNVIVAGRSASGTNRNGGTLTLSGGNSTGTGAGGPITISAGNTVSQNGANLTLNSGSSNTANGGQLSINGGTGDIGGQILIQAGQSTTANIGGQTYIRGGAGGGGNGGEVLIEGGSGNNSGNIILQTVSAVANVGNISISGGAATGVSTLPSNISISAGDSTGSNNGGNISINSGFANDSANTGNININTPNKNNSSNGSGNITLKTGNNSSTGLVGDIFITTGSSSSTDNELGSISLRSNDVERMRINRLGTLSFKQGFFSTDNDAKSSQYILRTTTTNNTLTEMFINGSDRMTLSTDSTWFFEIQLVARRTDASDESAAYRISGCIDRNTTTDIVGTVNVQLIAEDSSSWDVVVDADNTNNSLRIRVQGENSKTIRWLAVCRTVEVRN